MATLEDQITELESKIAEITEEKVKFEKVIARPYELKTVTIAEEHKGAVQDLFASHQRG